VLNASFSSPYSQQEADVAAGKKGEGEKIHNLDDADNMGVSSEVS
jgi:hypothetical protein